MSEREVTWPDGAKRGEGNSALKEKIGHGRHNDLSAKRGGGPRKHVARTVMIVPLRLHWVLHRRTIKKKNNIWEIR